MAYEPKENHVFVAGHRGITGEAVVRRLAQEDCGVITAARTELGLLDQVAVKACMQERRPDAIVMAAAQVAAFEAELSFDTSKLDGTPCKLMSPRLHAMGWRNP